LPSLQANDPVPTQLPFEQWSPVVHALPSSQVVVLALGLHADVLVAGVHCWQELLGFVAFAA
jgi:hypothetical protein